MKIIGHRGLSSLAPENSIEAAKKAIEVGVDGIEFDVWTSKDGVPVVHHDSNLARMTGFAGQIFDLDYAQIKKHKLPNGEMIPTAEEFLKVLGNTTAYLEIKDFYLSEGLFAVLKKNRGKGIKILSANHSVLLELQRRLPRLDLYPATHFRPLETIYFAKKNNMTGADINYLVFNPLAYLLTKIYKLEVLLFTINRPFYARIISRLKIKADVITNNPEKLISS